MTVGDEKMVVAETDRSVGRDRPGERQDAVDHAAHRWRQRAAARAEAVATPSATPMVEGQTVIFSGSDARHAAFKVEKKEAGKFDVKESVEQQGELRSSTTRRSVQERPRLRPRGQRTPLFCVNAETGKTAWDHSLMGRRGTGALWTRGPVLMALTPTFHALVFEPSGREYAELASYKNVGRQRVRLLPS